MVLGGLKGRKENESLKKNKKIFWISIIVMIISLLIAGMAQESIDEAQEQQAIEQIKL